VSKTAASFSSVTCSVDPIRKVQMFEMRRANVRAEVDDEISALQIQIQNLQEDRRSIETRAWKLAPDGDETAPIWIKFNAVEAKLDALQEKLAQAVEEGKVKRLKAAQDADDAVEYIGTVSGNGPRIKVEPPSPASSTEPDLTNKAATTHRKGGSSSNIENRSPNVADNNYVTPRSAVAPTTLFSTKGPSSKA
jgi:hypothetical protein